MNTLTIENVTSALRSEGKRMTPQRRIVVESLIGNTCHPSPEEVSDLVKSRMPGVSLSTIYNILNELASLGFLNRVNSVGMMRFDTQTHDHAHLHCRQCGAIIDIPVAQNRLSALRDIPTMHDGHIESVGIEYHGLCAACATVSNGS